MMKNNNIKIDLNQIKNFFGKVFFFGRKTWIFTIIFFLIIFGFSLWIWWGCILNPAPSDQVIAEIGKEQKDFEIKRKKIDQVIQKIQERKMRFDQASDHNVERKIFKSKEEIFKEMNPDDQSSGGSITGVNRLP